MATVDHSTNIHPCEVVWDARMIVAFHEMERMQLRGRLPMGIRQS
jgi:hypothetical protein